MPPETDFPTDLRALERDYELIREIGQGGMAAVYLARRRDTGGLVAIKAVRARYLDDADALQRFAREARTVAGLDHPNIVRTEAIEQIGDRAVAIIMEHVAGGTVRDRLREYGAFGAEQAEAVLRDVASALGYAHRRGIVHRDVKPENVFLDERTGRALLSDFGIARRIEGDSPITLLGSALGTPQYMSPEQIDGGMVDGRSDIYSLGVLGWELLTGRRPWAGESLYGVMYKQKHEELPRITSLRPRVPANLLFAIEGALAKDRERRWRSTDEFLEQLTYNPPPVLAQHYPAAAKMADNEPTVELRPVARNPAASPDSTRVRPPASAPPPDLASASLGAARDVDRAPVAASEAPRRVRRRGVIRALALVVPLAIAGVAWYVVLGGGGGTSRDGSPGVLTSSGGAVAVDSVSPADPEASARSRTMPPAAAPPRTDTVAPSAAPRPADTVVSAPRGKASPANTAPAGSDSARRDSAPAPRPVEQQAQVPVRPPLNPPSPGPTGASAAPTGAVPSPRCRIATIADQRACLLAYIAVNDAPLQRVYDSLIVELRRIAGAGRGQPDPPPVTRLRVEQRAWISVRDSECTRDPAPGSVPFWAQPLSECFAEMSAARADELGEALGRVRRQAR